MTTAQAISKPSLVARIRERFRDPNPILVKELLATFRTALFVRFLYIATGLVGIVVLSAASITASGPVPPAEVGQWVFHVFFMVALGLVMWFAPVFGATTITSERQGRTYESLVLSGMDPWRIVRGKFLATSASMFLVLIAIGPAVGTAFLFGGVSPTQVIIAFYSVFLVLALSVAFGVAVSSRLASTVVAIVVAFAIAFFAPMVLMGFSMAVGEGLASTVGVSASGPFWFAEAVATQPFDVLLLFFALVVPTFYFGMATWLCLAAAMAGVRPAAEDRSTAFKIWSVVMTLGALVTVAVALAVTPDDSTARDFGKGFAVASFMLTTFYALVFMNEPPLPPRRIEVARESYGFFRRLFTPFGPGAAPTMRFAVAIIFFTNLAIGALCVALPLLAFKPTFSAEYAGDIAGCAIGASAVASFAVLLGGLLRLRVGNGIATRLLVIAIAAILCILPLVIPLLLDFESYNMGRIPKFAWASPLLPAMLVVEGETEWWATLVPTVAYGSMALFMYVLVEVRVRDVRRVVTRRREEANNRARNSAPPPLAPLTPEVIGSVLPATAQLGGEAASAVEPAPEVTKPEGSAE